MQQSTPLTSERDRAVLRSFARRIDPSDAGAHNNLGVLYFNKGLHEEAAHAFTRALEIDPKMQVARRNLEIAYFSTGFYDRRMAQLRDRLRTRPEDREARWEIGRAHAALGDTREAVQEFSQLLAYHVNDIAAIVQLGLAEKANGDMERAQQWFERARDLDPASSLMHFYIGEVLYNRGLNEESLAALAVAIELNPDNPDVYFLMAFVLGDMGRHEDARAATKRAVKLNPALSRAQANLSLDRYNSARYGELVPEREVRRAQQRMEVSEEGQLAHYSLGLAFRQKAYYPEALREYQSALALGEDRGLVLQAIAEVHLLTGDTSAALSAYDEVLASHPDSPKLWNERGVALHQSGDHAGAAESYTRALALDPAYALALNNRGVALYHGGDSDEAMDAFRSVLGIQPAFTKAWLNFALLQLKAGRHQLSLEAYRQALESHAEHPVAWNGVGLVLVELNKLEKARNAFGRAIQARPSYAEAHYNLSFVLTSLGDFDGALRETKRALELDPYYVAQKFELAIDVQHEDPEMTIAPDLGGESRVESTVDAFAFDSDILNSLFAELKPDAAPRVAAEAQVNAGDPYALAVDYLSKGMLDRASAEISRAIGRGAERGRGLTLLGDAFARQALWGEALERYREARQHLGESRAVLAGETRALLQLGRVDEAIGIASVLLASGEPDVGTLMLVAEARRAVADHAGARELLDAARGAAPHRADVLKESGDAARAAGDTDAAILAYRGALALDGYFALARFELASLLAERELMHEAETELEAALDAVPTYVDAALELAKVRRKTGRLREALDPLIGLLQGDPYHIEALFLLAATLLDLGRQDDAAVGLERILRADPDHAGAIYYEGAVMAGRNCYRDAIERWDRVVRLAPGSEWADRARRDARTAVELRRIFNDDYASAEMAYAD
ncbi:MAG: tetratricopeptide repeat protein [Gemmatimonadota bacterium]|nr:tetratricopeptide repeat protein [Gemmatimonadota bacterium]